MEEMRELCYENLKGKAHLEDTDVNDNTNTCTTIASQRVDKNFPR
jgi:hypothetical protein